LRLGNTPLSDYKSQRNLPYRTPGEGWVWRDFGLLAAMTFSAATVRGAAGCLFAVALAILFGAGASIAAPEPTLSEMDHKSWTARDGAPQGITALALAADGVLWITSESGLFSFDGRTFTAFQSQAGEPDLPAGLMETILATRDGAIWIGYRFGWMARIMQGRVTLFTQVDRLPLAGIRYIRQAPDGSLWALADQQGRLMRFGTDGAWHMEPTPLGDSGGRTHCIFIDSSDTLWLDQGGRLYRRPLSEPKYFATEVQAQSLYGLTEAPDHSLWVIDSLTANVSRRTGRVQHVDPNGRLLGHLSDTDDNRDILYTSDGSLFLSGFGNGLLKLSADALAHGAQFGKVVHGDRYSLANGLASDVVKTLLQDADGNIWAGGYGGLDRFRRAQLIGFSGKYTTDDPRVCAGKTGEVWISAAGAKEQLYKVSGDDSELLKPTGQVTSISCGPDGDTWLIATNGIFKVHTNRITPVPFIPGVLPVNVYQVVATPDHTLYASVTGTPDWAGIWRYARGRWTKLTGPRIPSTMPYTEYVDPHGRLWTGNLGGVIGSPLEGGGRLLSSGNPGLGPVFAILETSHGLFAGGLNGLAVRRGDHFVMLDFVDRASTGSIAGLVESDNGDLWLSAARGVVHIPAAELQAALSTPRYPMKTELLAEGDFAGPIHMAPGVSTAARDREGRLWFATLSRVFHIDPKHLDSTAHLPILSIRSIEVDGKPVKAGEAVGPGVQTLDIQYLGVNLTAPEKVTYRYRLDGLDNSWQDAGYRAAAIFAHLPPGTYTFRVTASNDGHTWTVPLSSGSIRVLPQFYQTLWFLTLCVVLGLVLIWYLFTLRLGFLSREIRARAEERADERIRIARELHDTLLQGVQGLLLTFHVAAQKVSPDEESKKLLDNALSTADRIIVEGRNRVSSLRSEHLTDQELAGSLGNAARELSQDNTVAFRVSREGIDAKLHAHVADEVFYIGREALTNAFRHSQASEIVLQLVYGRRYFSMTCTDNGCGFDTDADKPGHWGLQGMLERAQRLGGKLRFKSEPMKGAQIVFVVPSFRVYEGHSRLRSFFQAYRRPECNPAE
jgi:signal transduction histidine kinase/ligand-binding sensor domain-containing protein